MTRNIRHSLESMLGALPWGALAMVMACAVLASCIREELPPCPPMHVDIVVKDKNYFNAAATEGLEPVRPENLPFKDYVGTLYYRLDNAETGELVIEQTNFEVSGDGTAYGVTFPESLPFGRYILTVWGNMHSERPLAEDATYTEVTENNAAENDIYVTVDTLDYTMTAANFTAELERTKGKLIVMAENLPAHVDFSTKDIDNIYRYVGRGLRYAGVTEFHTDTEWPEPQNMTTDMLLCPSTGHEETTLDVKFFDAAAQTKAAEPEDVKLTMSRNVVTVVRFVYQEGTPGDGFAIYVLVNDNWEQIHSMEID